MDIPREGKKKRKRKTGPLPFLPPLPAHLPHLSLHHSHTLPPKNLHQASSTADALILYRGLQLSCSGHHLHTIPGTVLCCTRLGSRAANRPVCTFPLYQIENLRAQSPAQNKKFIPGTFRACRWSKEVCPLAFITYRTPPHPTIHTFSLLCLPSPTTVSTNSSDQRSNLPHILRKRAFIKGRQDPLLPEGATSKPTSSLFSSTLWTDHYSTVPASHTLGTHPGKTTFFF